MKCRPCPNYLLSVLPSKILCFFSAIQAYSESLYIYVASWVLVPREDSPLMEAIIRVA